MLWEALHWGWSPWRPLKWTEVLSLTSVNISSANELPICPSYSFLVISPRNHMSPLKIIHLFNNKHAPPPSPHHPLPPFPSNPVLAGVTGSGGWGGGHKLAERNKTDHFFPQERHEQKGGSGSVNKRQFGPGLRVYSLWARLPGLIA